MNLSTPLMSLALTAPFLVVGCEAMSPSPAATKPAAAPVSTGNDWTLRETEGEYDVLGILKEEYREPRMKEGTAAALDNGATAADIRIVRSAWGETGAQWLAEDSRTGEMYEANASNKFKKVYITPAPASE